ncbi:c-type cytochrome [Hymenobacter sp. CRA2]|uniref:c-type cytochrome n=1 Tax=Hymenobacter sp. CRA2 TaxID=1955620 RepID=UPI00098FD988|nr:c-type cytochrome [Hymenobacter sp. CRA2]OON70178.1 hypothetical protein B0919_05440 [Hymenobacter sp. CRA2]
MKKILRIVGLLVAGLVFLGACAATFVQVRGVPSYALPKVAAAHIEATPERLLKGEQIALSICADCHLDKQTGRLSGQPLREIPDQFGRFYSANITQDKRHGIGSWTDEQLVALLRTNIGPDGRLRVIMPNFGRLSDEDLASVITFLRSGSPLVQPHPAASRPQEPSFFGKVLANTVLGPKPMPTAAIAHPDTANEVELGRYLVLARYKCYDCHCKDGLKIDGENPERTEGYMAGGTEIMGENHQNLYTRNLTPDAETGIGDWTEAQFVQAMKYGASPHGPLRYPMPKYSRVPDPEARAIFAYLRTLPAIHNATPEDGPEGVAAVANR